MNTFLRTAMLLAEGEAAQPENSQPGLGPLFLPGLILIALVFYLIFIVPEKRRGTDQKKLLDSLKKNDRVVTIGGIYGVVTNVQKEQDRVTVRVDDSTGATIKVTFAAIARIMSEESADDKSAST